MNYAGGEQIRRATSGDEERMFEHLVKHYDESGESVPAISLYKSVGFRTIGRAIDLFRINGQSVSDLQMCLNLDELRHRATGKPKFIVRHIESSDRESIHAFIIEHWGAEQCIAHGQVFIPHLLPGFVAVTPDESRPIGVLTYFIDNGACEIITFNNASGLRGVGTALIDTLRQHALTEAYNKIWLVTNNDNLDAIRFYQKRGFRLVAIRRNAVAEARKLKPQIPITGHYGIPLLDEVEMEMAP